MTRSSLSHRSFVLVEAGLRPRRAARPEGPPRHVLEEVRLSSRLPELVWRRSPPEFLSSRLGNGNRVAQFCGSAAIVTVWIGSASPTEFIRGARKSRESVALRHNTAEIAVLGGVCNSDHGSVTHNIKQQRLPLGARYRVTSAADLSRPTSPLKTTFPLYFGSPAMRARALPEARLAVEARRPRRSHGKRFATLHGQFATTS